MAIASFKDLCDGFCEAVRIPSPELKADAEGLVAFHVILRGFTVNLAHRPETVPEHVFIVFEAGPLAHARALLEANFVPFHLNPPVFSCDPATGNVILQCVYALPDATPTGLFELINQGIDWLSDWRENFVGDAPVSVSEGPPPSILQQFA